MKSTYKFHFVNVSDLLQYEDFKAVIAIPFVINIGPLISNFETYFDRYLHPNLVLALVYSGEKNHFARSTNGWNCALRTSISMEPYTFLTLILHIFISFDVT